jgi:nitric oxide reductase subunit C
MSERLTKAAARNIFYGGSAFFFLVFVGLTALSHNYILNTGSNTATLTDGVARGKAVWEKNACINCHTILGEGAYFAPELGNVMARWGVENDPAASYDTLKSWMEAQPSGIEGRRQMPQFHLTDQEIRDLSEFLSWVGTIKTQNWPPNKAG